MKRFRSFEISAPLYLVTCLAAAGTALGAIGIDANVVRNQGTASSTVRTPQFSTTTGNELLLAFVSTDSVTTPNTTVTSVTGAGLTWVLVRRTNVQRGTAEIWRAFAPSPLTNVTVTAGLSQSVSSMLTVLSFTGVDTAGTNGAGAIGATGSANANPGAPSASLITTRGGSLVLGVGSDWDNPVSRTPDAGQIMVRQYLSPVGDTYWVQRRSSAIPSAGSTAIINDIAPATDRYNLTIVEVLPAGGASGTFNISGAIAPAASGSGAQVTLSGAASRTTTADGSGNYLFAGLANGSYVVTPSRTGYLFSPTAQNVTINGANATNVNFTATAVSTLKSPDLSVIIPSGAISVVRTSAGKEFQYTHDTFNGGPGPLVIQPAYNAATGNYQGTQYVYAQNPNGTWTLTRQVPLAGVFVFHAVHGHFHFPFAVFGIYAVGPDGGPGSVIIPSEKIGFCIADSFIYDPTLPNAGALGNLGSCADPLSLRGLDIGAVDEYDRSDDGQSINIDGLPDGTYWLRALVDPNNFFAEADKTNNETDVKFTLSGTNVQVLQTVAPVLAPPPAITMTSPADGGIVSGIVQFTANTSTTTGVQYLVDGMPFGPLVTAPPYARAWDSSTVTNGAHWLAAQTTDPTGVIGTSPVTAVTVSNSGPTFPTVQLTSPADGSIVSATITLYAIASANLGIANVTFFVDDMQLGSPVTTPPYSVPWDTTAATPGPHVITVAATDTAGHVGTSAGATVIVDNAHAPNVIGIDAQVSVDGAGTMTTPTFSTAAPGDLLVAFVSYDGPLGSPQTATITGAGLTWTLLVRSNTQGGTSEVWSAKPSGTLASATVTAQQQVGGGYHGSLTVIAFRNAAGTSVVGRAGAATGAPDIYLPGVVAGDWVFAVGNDWDRAIARTPVSGQVLVHQRVDTQVGDTFWVQSTAAPSTANALVDIRDTAPTTDQWNYAAVEVVATHQ